MSKETIDILTNKEAIFVNQDPLGIQGLQYSAQDSLEIWFKPLSDGAWAVCFLNRSVEVKLLEFVWQEHPVNDNFSKRNIDFKKTTFTIRNLWAKKNIGTTKKPFAKKIPAHDVSFLMLKPVTK